MTNYVRVGGTGGEGTRPQCRACVRRDTALVVAGISGEPVSPMTNGEDRRPKEARLERIGGHADGFVLGGLSADAIREVARALRSDVDVTQPGYWILDYLPGDHLTLESAEYPGVRQTVRRVT